MDTNVQKMKELNDFLDRLDPRASDVAKMELARLCNLSLYTIDSYRRGNRSPKPATRVLINEYISKYKRKHHGL